MNQYVTGEVIRRLREGKGLTQEELAERIHVGGKAVSKWETGKGFPDVSLLEPLAQALGISVIELFSGDAVQNRNKAANMARSRMYVCPVCGNVILSAGEAVVSCCGITLPPQEAEAPDGEHNAEITVVEDEYFVSVRHPMTREHYISCILYRTGDRIETVKLYPEGNAECRFLRRGRGEMLAYCNHHGLFRVRI